MKRIQEKVKDLIEVNNYQGLQNFASDQAQTLASYYFTDATSELMAKWLDALVNVQPQNGSAKALAGYRGVGKSHFFGAFAAIVSNPDLRSKISDSHVSASAQYLKRRRYPVVTVRRGTNPELATEILDAFRALYPGEAEQFANDWRGLIAFAVEKSGDLPLVLMFDTAHERASRVARDDGEILGEISEYTKNLNCFIAAALDDDIAGADGVNAGIARNFSIDFLDQEHLYKVVEGRLFPKNRQAAATLHEIYEDFRQCLPGFRWSEQKFQALYPIHPVILELAQFVRLYTPDFAFLGFAAEAGAKNLGRPANSLVALDELFDRVENSLRKSEDLKEVFRAFDLLSNEVIAQLPVMERLPAKIILKALLLLSLDGDGTSVTEISAATLFNQNDDLQKTHQTIEKLLDNFAVKTPEDITRQAADDKETRYSLKISGKENLNKILEEASIAIPNEVFDSLLRRVAHERLPDWNIKSETEAENLCFADFQIVWRGGVRRGRVGWMPNHPECEATAENSGEFYDWEVIIGDPATSETARHHAEPTVFWQPAALKPEEEETLRRYYVLLTDNGLKEKFGEQIRAFGQTYQKNVLQIWNRIFLHEAKFTLDGREISAASEAFNSPQLSGFLNLLLTPQFEERYPEHPEFLQTLGISEVAQTISEHFSGAKSAQTEAQVYAEMFALPLGLVAFKNEKYLLDSDDKLSGNKFVSEVLSLVEANRDETVPLKNIYSRLKEPPFGLVHEAAHLVLAALVAQRRLEFVTSKGDRINRRSLDLKIMWGDIAGVAVPVTVLYSSEKLTDWARTLTAADDFRTIDDPEDKVRIKNNLNIWLSDWKTAGLLENFENLPSEILNTRIWYLAAEIRKTFGMAASTIESVLDDTISLEEGLQRIADFFSDSEMEFLRISKNVLIVQDYISGIAEKTRVWEYIAVCETTDDEKIESWREKMLEIIDEMNGQPSEALNQELARLWQAFHEKFSEYYAVKHYTVMKSHHLQEQLDEIIRSDEWWEFENLSALTVFDKKHWHRAQSLLRRLQELNCNFDVRELLKTHPFCACSFRLAGIKDWEKLPSQLIEAIAQGRRNYRKTLTILSQTLIPVFERFSMTENSTEFIEAAAALAGNISNASQIPIFNNSELVILKKAIQAMPAAPMLHITLPSDIGFLSREDLRGQMSEWLDELPSEPVLLKV